MLFNFDIKIRKFKNRIRHLFFSGVNWRKTILFNYRMLPRHIAKYLPIVLYGNVDISKCTGEVEIITNMPIRHQQWIIGESDCWVNGRYTSFEMTYLAIGGKLQLHGEGRIANGCRIYVRENAVLSLGDEFFLNANSRIACYKEIIIGDSVQISWNAQIYDTDFHYMISEDGVVHRRNQPVRICDHAWIGHDTTIGKGAMLGKGCILAAHSMLNRNYEEENCIYAGYPARKVKKGVHRIYDEPLERSVRKFFRTYPNEKSCKVNTQNLKCIKID